MRTLVTGAGGQVGLDLIRRLLADGDEVHASDVRARPASAEDLPSELPWHHLDVANADAVRGLFAQIKPERVFHLAAILSARGESMPDVTYQINQNGAYHVLEACRHEGVRQLMFTSTIAVFGPGLPAVVGDDVPLMPTTMYGVTKAAGEMLGNYYHQRFGLDFRGIRFPGLISASRIPLMYMPDGIRALIELSNAPRSRLGRCVYNIAGFSPTAQEIAYTVKGVLPQAKFTFEPDPKRQAILDSW